MITLHDGSDVPDGTPVKLVNGEYHALTQLEINNRNAEIAAYNAAKPLVDWEAQMRKSDTELMANARIFEDLLNWAIAAGYVPPVNTTTGRSAAGDIADRVTHRGNRPV